MLRRILTAMLALVLCLSLLPMPEAQAATKAKTLTVTFEATTYQNRARSLLKLINQYREKNGAEPLTMLADLEKLSIQRAAELFVFFVVASPYLLTPALIAAVVLACIFVPKKIAKKRRQKQEEQNPQ